MVGSQRYLKEKSYFLFKPLVTQEGRNNQCKTSTSTAKAAFPETKWAFGRACKWSAGLTDLPKLQTVPGQQNQTGELKGKQNRDLNSNGPGHKPAPNGRVRKTIPIYSKIIPHLSTPGILTLFPEALVLGYSGCTDNGLDVSGA